MIAYLLPFLAIVLGMLIALSVKQSNKLPVKLLLSFSGAFLLALTLFGLLPEVYAHLDGKITGLFIMLGILTQIVLEFFSKGAEHGHLHLHLQKKSFPWWLFTSLCIHNFLEGFPIHGHSKIAYGVFIHNIPIAILLTTCFVQAKIDRSKLAIFMGVFALMTPLGTLVSQFAAFPEMYANCINAVAIGIFLHISTTILFESSEGHKFNLSKLTAIVLGVLVAYLI
ncbi:MAG TPA: ZIP family metal transporter [Aquaticitalea sp.]|nr:ZIP family metal transporter [Aquaticitalea sp.]